MRKIKTKNTTVQPKARAPDGSGHRSRAVNAALRKAGYAASERTKAELRGAAENEGDAGEQEEKPEAQAAETVSDAMTGAVYHSASHAVHAVRALPEAAERFRDARREQAAAKDVYRAARDTAEQVRPAAAAPQPSAPKESAAPQLAPYPRNAASGSAPDTRAGEHAQGAARTIREKEYSVLLKERERPSARERPPRPAKRELAGQPTAKPVPPFEQRTRQAARGKTRMEQASQGGAQVLSPDEKPDRIRERRTAESTQKSERPQNKAKRAIKQKDYAGLLQERDKPPVKTHAAQAKQAAGRTAKQAAAKAAQAASGQAVKLAGHQARHAARAVTKATVKAVWQAVQALLVGAAAGGWAIVLVIVLIAAAALFTSPLGILFSDDRAEGTAVSQIIREVNADQLERLGKTMQAHPDADSSEIRYLDSAGTPSTDLNWCDVIAVYAVQKNMEAGQDMTALDEGAKADIEQIFFDANEIATKIEEYTEMVEQQPPPEEEESGTAEPDGGGEDSPESGPVMVEVVRHRLIVTITRLSADELAEKYRFAASQKEVLQEMLREPLLTMLRKLCAVAVSGGGAVVDPGDWDGTLRWPLPGYTHLSTHFGEADAIYQKPHGGIDIPAPLGTPVQAAGAGTVSFAGWHNSYGNYVMLDHGDGMVTLYGHLSALGVSTGDTVGAGQTIGLVGSTGDSTGNHLHFEVRINGTKQDPLGYVRP